MRWRVKVCTLLWSLELFELDFPLEDSVHNLRAVRDGAMLAEALAVGPACWAASSATARNAWSCATPTSSLARCLNKLLSSFGIIDASRHGEFPSLTETPVVALATRSWRPRQARTGIPPSVLLGQAAPCADRRTADPARGNHKCLDLGEHFAHDRQAPQVPSARSRGNPKHRASGRGRCVGMGVALPILRDDLSSCGCGASRPTEPL